MTVLFRANFQNTLTPEVGTYDNTSEKTGSFGLDGGEYYLQNSNNTKGYYFYYLASGSDNSKLTITFDIAIVNSSSSGWSVLFSGSDSNWWGLFTSGTSFSLNTKSGGDTSLGSYSISTWHTVKITQEVSLGTLKIKVYIDDVEKADISRATSYAITNLLLLGNTSTSWAAYGTVLKNVLITDGEEEEEPTPSGVLKYLNFTGLSNLVTNIKNWVTARIPTKTSEITNDSGFITSSSLPTVNNATLTIQKNSSNVATFTANASSNVTANITVPTAVSELTNDSGYLTAHQAVSNSAPTLAWGTTSTIGSVGGTNLTVTMPANPNTDTDTKVTQTVTTGNTFYPVLTHATATATTTVTDTARFSKGAMVNARYGYFLSQNPYDTAALKGTRPTSTYLCGALVGRTYDGANVGQFRSEMNKGGYNRTFMQAINYITNGAVATDGTAISASIIIDVLDDGSKRISTNGLWLNNLTPITNNTYSLGTSSLRWKEVYSNSYYLGTTAFGDIVTHNASEFLTSHQSLANYVTLNSDQTISSSKRFAAQQYRYNTSYDAGQNTSTTDFGFTWIDKDLEAVAWINRCHWSNNYSGLSLGTINKYTNDALATNGTAVSSYVEICTTPTGVPYLNTNAGWWCSVRPANNDAVDLGTTSLKWRNLFIGEMHCYHQNALMAKNGSYTFLLRNDGSSIWFLISEANGNEGTWSGLRPLYINCSTGACTTSSKWTFDKSFGDGDPSILIQSGTAYANGTWNYPLAALAPNMKAGANLFMPIGRNFAAGNCAGWRWNYAGNNSNDNYVSVEFYAAGSPLAVYRDGRVVLSASPAASDNSNRVATTAYVKANAYTHPTTAGNKHIPSGGSTGQILRYSASGTAVWANRGSFVSIADRSIASLTSTGSDSWTITTVKDCVYLLKGSFKLSSSGASITIHSKGRVIGGYGTFNSTPGTSSNTTIYNYNGESTNTTYYFVALIWATDTSLVILSAGNLNTVSMGFRA